MKGWFNSVEDEVEISDKMKPIHSHIEGHGVEKETTHINTDNVQHYDAMTVEKSVFIEEPLVFSSHRELWRARCCSIFHLSSPYVAVVILFLVATYVNCMLQIFAQITVENNTRIKVTASLQRINTIRSLTANLSTDLRNSILLESLSLIPWAGNMRPNDTLSCTVDNCTQVVDPLFDVSFSVLPFITPEQAPRLADYYLLTWGIISVIRFLFCGVTFLTLARRYLFLHSIIFLLRGLSIAMTILPNPYPGCVAQLNSNVIVAGFLIMFGANYTCMDVFFSGHSVFLGLIMMTWLRYNGKGYVAKVMNIFVILVTLGGWLMIVMTHFHYTLDVCYGALISVTFYRIYLIIIGTEFGKQNLFLIWFEGIQRDDFEDELDVWWNDHRSMTYNDEITKRIFAKAGIPYENELEWKNYLNLQEEKHLAKVMNVLVHKEHSRDNISTDNAKL
jgi:hypothetical protein